MPPNQVLYSTPNLWKKQSMNEKQVTHKNDSSSFFHFINLLLLMKKIFSGQYSVFKLLDLSSWSGDGPVPDLPVLEETVDGWVDVAASGEQSWNKIIPLSIQSSKDMKSKQWDQWLNPTKWRHQLVSDLCYRCCLELIMTGKMDGMLIIYRQFFFNCSIMKRKAGLLV